AIILGILFAVLVGMAGGALNAFTISSLKLPAFIATLASMYIFQGIAMVICNGAQEVNLPRTFQMYFGHAKLFGYIPYQVIAAVLIGVILHLIMRYTQFGLHVRATGSNRESARRAGINVTKITLQVYLLTGALAAIAGCFDIARFATTNPSGHQTDGMMAIMAAVMGGTSMKGGIASVLGAMLATLIPVSLSIGMVVLNINSFYQLVVTGIFLIIAVYVDYIRNMRPSK
ncbi:MAG: ABC transporter permease, partial [Clostridia bacterium]|nr:ABC transporter permease [Clostridia bacterium]